MSDVCVCTGMRGVCEGFFVFGDAMNAAFTVILLARELFLPLVSWTRFVGTPASSSCMSTGFHLRILPGPFAPLKKL